MNIFHWVIYTYFAFLFLYSCFLRFVPLNLLIVSLGSFLLFKWITNYRLCTVSYIEVMIRNIPLHKGYMFNFMEELVDFNQFTLRYILYLIVILIIIRNIYILKYK